MRNLSVLFFTIFIIGFVSANFGNSGTTSSFSGGVGYQNFNPSYSSIYSGGDINTYWPQLAEDIAEGKCEGNTDFLVMIPPAGCTPSVVRTDLLAEQNVPVFCQLESAKVNPLIRMSSIKSISFRGKYPPEIAGVSYYPARAAINSYTTLLGSPVVNNIGYVVIVLKKQSNESASPKNVSGNLTATLYYDAERAFGVGSSEFYLREMSDDDWELNKNLQSFWQGRGLLRLVELWDDSAKIQILGQNGAVLRTETLKRGETGSLFYFPGFYCRAAMRLKLNDLEAPEASAILSVDGIQMEVRKGTVIPNTECRVLELSALSSNMGSIKLSCRGKNFDLGLTSLYKANFSVGESSGVYEMTDYIVSDGKKYYFAYAGVSRRDIEENLSGSDFVVLVRRDFSLDSNFYSELAINIDKVFDEKRGVSLSLAEFKNQISRNTARVSSGDIVILFKDKGSEGSISFNGFVDSSIESNLETNKVSEDNKKLAAHYLDEADNVLDTLLNEYYSLPSEYRYGETGLYEEILLIERLQQAGVDYRSKKIELLERFLDLYPDSDYSSDIASKLNMARRTDASNSYISVFSNNEYHTLGVVQFKPVNRASKSFEFVVNNKKVVNSETNNLLFYEGDLINLSRLGSISGANDYLIVKEIKSREVIFEYYSTRIDSNGEKTSELFNANFRLEYSLEHDKIIPPVVLDSGNTKNSAYGLYISDVHIDKVAHVSIVSELKTTSEANFTFNIGIEQRAIKITPEQAKSRADELNKTIKEWEDKNAKIGKLVEGWKAVCLTTNMVLSVKNLITGFSGQATARQEVMVGYKTQCRKEVQEGSFPTVDACYSHYSSEINKDVDEYTTAIKGVNEDLQRKYHNNLSEFQESGDCSYTAQNGMKITSKDVGSWSEARQCLLYMKLEGNSKISKYTRAELNANTAAQLGHTAANLKANQEYETLVDQLPEILKSSYFTTSVQNKVGTTVSSFKTVNKTELRKVFNSGVVSSVFDLNVGDSAGDFVSVATTYYAGTWYLLVYGGGNVLTNTYNFTLENKNISGITEQSGGEVGVLFNENYVNWNVDVTSNRGCSYNYTNPTVRFYESAESKGLPQYVPVDLKNGWYVYVPPAQGNLISQGTGTVGYTDAGEITFMYLCNVGPNGREDLRQNDDVCQSFNTNNDNYQGFSGCSLSPSDVRNLINRAKSAVRSVAGDRRTGVRSISIPGVGDNVVVEPGSMEGYSGSVACQDFFSPEECKLLFNVCDPVICPPSRCNFGGKIAVPNVIQSGILGSMVLCMKNFVGFGGDVYIPVCLTGVHAGIEGYISILKAQQNCLRDYSETGKHTGICDEMTAIYKCEFFWRQVSPLMKTIVPSLAELVYTAKWNGQANGGEYLTFKNSWDNMQRSIDYFKDSYAPTSFTAFRFGDVEEMGSLYCKNFLGTSLPTSAKAIDSLLKPESPAQYYGTFSSISYSSATVPPTSHYKIFYHIYAGTDIGARYHVYLKNPPSLSYFTIPSQVVIDSGYINKGDQVSETKDITLPSGYKELCLVVNDVVECGFNSVSTDFAVDVINDLHVQEQAGYKDIKTEEECISGSASIYSLVNPNIQEGADDFINPDISLLGITRVCATQNPGLGKESSNWINVGSCGSVNLTCWLDNRSVRNAQKVLQNVGSITEAVEYLSLEGPNAKVSEDMKSTEEALAKLKGDISSLDIGKVQRDISSIDSSLNNILKLAKSTYNGARLDMHKANALYLQMQIYFKVVKSILDVKDSKEEKTPSSVVESPPTQTSDPGENTAVEKSDSEKIVAEILERYTFKHQSGSIYRLEDKDGVIPISGDYIPVLGYSCKVTSGNLECKKK